MKHQLSNKNIGLILATIFLFCSCTQQKIKENMQVMQSHAVMLETDNMICLSNDTTKLKYDKPLKLVVYNDSSVCKPCLMAHISEWTGICNTPACKDVDFYFIFSAKEADIEEYRKGYVINDVQHPVLLDTANVFQKSNPHIPGEWIYHTFLLDENDKIIFVGNPLRDTKMEKLFYKVLNQKGDNSVSFSRVKRQKRDMNDNRFTQNI